MYSSKQNVLELSALLKAHHVQEIILCPGSRNAPIIHNLSQHPYFNTHLVVDERNAGFFALGIILKTNRPAAVCCTSGSALLNLAPAVAEAYYSGLPLIIISADRAPEWIGQMDGQTIPQPDALQTITKRSVNIPEIKDQNDHWLANRLINEALITATNPLLPAPIHINIPIAEPMLDFTAPDFPPTRVIEHLSENHTTYHHKLQSIWRSSSRKLIIVGQLPPNNHIQTLLQEIHHTAHCVVLHEHIANLRHPAFVSNFDTILATTPNKNRSTFSPDIVITLGGHIISKRLKQLLRQHPPTHHWHITPPGGQLADLFQCLTLHVEAPIPHFLKTLKEISQPSGTSHSNYQQLWEQESQKIAPPNDNLPFSDIYAMEQFIRSLPPKSALHLGNSSVVRNAQLCSAPNSVSIFSCRGVNGIESPLPTAIGYASSTQELTFLAIGDLSFFYSIGALWQIHHLKNLRIILFNNRGGAIFHTLPGMNKSKSLQQYIGAEHDTQAKLWAYASQANYLSASDKKELAEALPAFVAPAERPQILEVLTNIETCQQAITTYLNTQKNNRK